MISIYQLKPRFQNLLRPLVQRLYDNGTTANQITVLAGVISLLVRVPKWPSNCWPGKRIASPQISC